LDNERVGEQPSSADRADGRRTQAQRRAETRTALLDATIESLISYGYTGTTTGRIAQLAGVSRGAQAPYFRTRAALVGAAVIHLADQRVAAAKVRFAGGPMTIPDALDSLWEEHRGVAFHAALELWVASRTDADLRAELHQVERQVGLAIAEVAESAIGAAATRPGFTEDLLVALSTIRGLALLQLTSEGSGRALTALWEHTRERLTDMLS
jgi:AcrR family transcriptional regulator